jgi:hypothetical protein
MSDSPLNDLEEPEQVLFRARPLLIELHKAFETAIPVGLDYFTWRKAEHVNSTVFSALVRYEVKEWLNRAGFTATEETEEDEADGRLIGDATCDLQSLANNGLLLTYKGLRIRIRKAFRSSLPFPGSRTQRDFYQQRFCFDTEGIEDPVMNLLVLWDVDSNYRFQSLKLVSPKMAALISLRRNGRRQFRIQPSFWRASLPIMLIIKTCP